MVDQPTLIRRDFYLNGFLKGQFPDNNTLRTLRKELLELQENSSIMSGFSWDEKYPGTVDLRPSATEYSPSILQIIKVARIIDWIKNLSGIHVDLTHVQIRKSFPSNASYMSWHRDSYAKGKTWLGPIPPTFKLIFYPGTTESTSPCLEISNGTHRSQLAVPLLDKLQPLIREKTTLYPSLNTFMFFDSSTLHRAVPNRHNTSIRIIYIFRHAS